MAIEKAETQITFDTGTAYDTVAASGNTTSDAMTFSADAFAAQIECKADNGGTPADGDEVDFYILYTLGDPDGASSDEYDTVDHASLLCTLDTYAEDPAIKTVPVNPVAKGFEIYVVSRAASNSHTISCTLYEATG
jgi:hypothetical protein